MSTLHRTSDAQFFIVPEDLCTLSRAERCTRGSTDGPVRILGEREGKDPEFQKEYLSCPMRCKNLSENFRAILKSSRYQKNQRDECMIARPDRAILQLAPRQEVLALDCRRMQKT